MKKFILSALIAAAGLFVGVNNADAGNRFHDIKSYTGHSFKSNSYSGHNYSGHNYSSHNHCAPKVYTLRTYEVDRCRHQKAHYDHCGNVHYHWVTVVTYKTVYSNGTWKTFTRTFS